ncbi:Organic hydroperoxide resistance transcriptional regulator [Labilithrix luteola]|uniref:Organic hydroperoxide resistance transcriptional regulator n=1 Tax=Labilithrix luteola TaxID=1391654 RepID=A0A0K1PTF1_9BACT|nr:MarR family transcriptional regulator [Labilithrix luteola]AKU96813.1 Organic hydroperoxide resistance transcriptional regulator [Labilithrix luteola]
MGEDSLLLDNQVCFALYAASRAMTAAYQPLLEPLGLTYPQYLVLLVLWETDGIRVSQIGERLHLDSGTLTPLLKRLETQGVIERRRSAGDERVVEVHLTAAGKRLRKAAAEIPKALLCKTGGPAEDLVRLQKTVRKLTQNLLDSRKESNP